MRDQSMFCVHLPAEYVFVHRVPGITLAAADKHDRLGKSANNEPQGIVDVQAQSRMVLDDAEHRQLEPFILDGMTNR